MEDTASLTLGKRILYHRKRLGLTQDQLAEKMGVTAQAVARAAAAQFGIFFTLVAAVMLGSTETTFYTIAVYFGSAGIIRTRHTVPAALAADLTGFLASAFAVRLFFGA